MSLPCVPWRLENPPLPHARPNYIYGASVLSLYCSLAMPLTFFSKLRVRNRPSSFHAVLKQNVETHYVLFISLSWWEILGKQIFGLLLSLMNVGQTSDIW